MEQANYTTRSRESEAANSHYTWQKSQGSFFIQKNPLYSGLSTQKPPKHSKFTKFPADSLYIFPVLNATTFPHTEELSKGLFNLSEFTQVDSIDMKKSLKQIQEKSPFTRGDIADLDRSAAAQDSPQQSLCSLDGSLPLLNQFNLAQELEFQNSNLSGSQQSSSYSYHGEERKQIELSMHARDEILQIQKNFLLNNQNDKHLNSMSLRSSVEEPLSFCSDELVFNEEQMSAIDWGGARVEESNLLSFDNSKRHHAVAELVAEGASALYSSALYSSALYSSASGLQLNEEDVPSEETVGKSHPARIFLAFTASKCMLSRCPEFPQSSAEAPDPFSPLYRKLVICQQMEDASSAQCTPVDIICSIPSCGFSAVPTIKYSNRTHCTKGIIQYFTESLFNSLFSMKVATTLSVAPVAWLSCGFEHCVAVTALGGVLSWGYGASGCLGHGNTNTYAVPTAIEALKGQFITYVECGGYHNAAVSDKRELWVWGRSDVHQLGLPNASLHKDDIGYVAFTPLHNKNLKGVVNVSCGEAHTLVLETTGKIRCFGWGEHGQLGIEQSELVNNMTNTVRTVELHEKAVGISAGAFFSACVTEKGQLKVWGNGQQGQLGLGRHTLSSIFPALVGSLKDEVVLDLVCGENFAICLCENKKVYGWGQGIAGQFEGSGFAAGSEIVCYVPRELSSIDIAHRLILREFSVDS